MATHDERCAWLAHGEILPAWQWQRVVGMTSRGASVFEGCSLGLFIRSTAVIHGHQAEHLWSGVAKQPGAEPTRTEQFGLGS